MCLLYINMLRVISLSFIVLPELVKHILVAGVVRRNIKFSVIMRSAAGAAANLDQAEDYTKCSSSAHQNVSYRLIWHGTMQRQYFVANFCLFSNIVTVSRRHFSQNS